MLNMMETYMEHYLAPYVKNEEGQGMVEYGLIIALVAVFAIVGLALIGPTLSQMFTDINADL